MNTHRLKTWPEFFGAVSLGKKPFEVRANDRDFKVGDALVLEEYCPEAQQHTGRRAYRHVGYILDDPRFCKEGTVILGFEAP